MEEINFLSAYRAYLELYQTYLDRGPRIDEIYISDGRHLPEDSDGGIYQFNLTESEFLGLDKMMSGELKVLINEQEYEKEILSFDKESIVIRLKGVRDRRIERVCFAGDAEFLKRITEKQIGILENLHENQSKRNILFGNFEGAERVPCSFEDNILQYYLCIAARNACAFAFAKLLGGASNCDTQSIKIFFAANRKGKNRVV